MSSNKTGFLPVFPAALPEPPQGPTWHLLIINWVCWESLLIGYTTVATTTALAQTAGCNNQNPPAPLFILRLNNASGLQGAHVFFL